MNAQEIFGWSATCLTAGFYVSLITPFFKIFKGKLSYEDAPIVVITVSYINCFSWCIYGNMISSNQIKICNMIGVISTLILMIIYLIYEIKKYCLDSFLNALILLLGSIVIYKSLTIIINDAQIIGKICIIAKFFVFVSPIQLVYRVIKEKNYILIPIFASFVSFLSCICWVLYGFFINDFHVVIPNATGILLAFIQFFVYSFYKKKYPNISQKSPTIDIESTSLEESKNEATIIKIDEESQKTVKEKSVKIETKEEI